MQAFFCRASSGSALPFTKIFSGRSQGRKSKCGFFAGLVGAFWAVAIVWLAPRAVAQPAGFANAVPTAEYYTAYDLFQDGQSLNALQGFQAALKKAKQINGERFVDSIPPMVYAGESLYAQGNLGAAMEHYDAALAIALRWPNWMDELTSPTNGGMTGSGDDAKTKGIAWAEMSRKVKRGQFIGTWTCKVVNEANGVATVAESIQLNAIEVMRCQAIALRRRMQILGPLSLKSPLTNPLMELYRGRSTTTIPIIQAARNVCLGLASAGGGDTNTAVNLLQKNASLADSIDHPLTPIALLSLAELSDNSDNLGQSATWANDAGIAAAQFEQLDILADAVQRLFEYSDVRSSNPAVAVRLAGTFKAIAAWSQLKSRMVQVRCLCAMAELATAARNPAETETIFKQGLKTLTANELSLPRLHACLRYAFAQGLLATGKLAEGQNMLYQAIAIVHGDEQGGTSAKRLFQLRLAESLLRAGQLDASSAELLLQRLLTEPTHLEWRCDPIESFAWMTADKRPAFDLLLELKVQGGSIDEILATADHRLRNQYWQALALSGRVLSFAHQLQREALASNNASSNSSNASNSSSNGAPNGSSSNERPGTSVKLQARYPDVIAGLQEFMRVVDDWNNRPLVADGQASPSDVNGRQMKLNELARTQINRVWQIAASSDATGRSFPPATPVRQVQSSLSKEDGIITFYRANDLWNACLITGDGIDRWNVGNMDDIDSLILTLAKEMGVGLGKPATVESAKTQPWRLSLTKLSQQVFPADKQARLKTVKRLFVVPDGKFWYCPFEILSLGSATPARPLIADKQIVYVPTLGLVPQSFMKTPPARSMLGVVKDQFFSHDAAVQKQAVQELTAASRNVAVVTLGQGSNRALPSNWARLRTQRAWIATPLNLGDLYNMSLFAYDAQAPESKLGAWLEFPIGMPTELVLMGAESSIVQARPNDGNDLFQLACSAMACGNQTLLVSRWPVGGASSPILLRAFLEELDSERASAAWQRSVFSFWSEHLDAKSEPVLNSSGTIQNPADLPVLWAGYALIGDTLPSKK